MEKAIGERVYCLDWDILLHVTEGRLCLLSADIRSPRPLKLHCVRDASPQQASFAKADAYELFYHTYPFSIGSVPTSVMVIGMRGYKRHGRHGRHGRHASPETKCRALSPAEDFLMSYCILLGLPSPSTNIPHLSIPTLISIESPCFTVP